MWQSNKYQNFLIFIALPHRLETEQLIQKVVVLVCPPVRLILSLWMFKAMNENNRTGGHQALELFWEKVVLEV